MIQTRELHIMTEFVEERDWRRSDDPKERQATRLKLDIAGNWVRMEWLTFSTMRRRISNMQTNTRDKLTGHVGWDRPESRRYSRLDPCHKVQIGSPSRW